MVTTEPRVAKFDKNGKVLMAWGEKGSNQNDTRPAYFNNVHGIAVDPKTRRVFVNDRGNHRARCSTKTESSRLVAISATRRPTCTCSHHERRLSLGRRPRHEQNPQVTTSAATSSTRGDDGRFPGGMWGVHGMSTDQDGKLLRRRVDNGGVAEIPPAAAARTPAFLVGKPVSRPGSKEIS